jgi:hypothetical protein
MAAAKLEASNNGNTAHDFRFPKLDEFVESHISSLCHSEFDPESIDLMIFSTPAFAGLTCFGISMKVSDFRVESVFSNEED